MTKASDASPYRVIWQLSPATLVHHSPLVGNSPKEVDGCCYESSAMAISFVGLGGLYPEEHSHNAKYTSRPYGLLGILNHTTTCTYRFRLEKIRAFVRTGTDK
jgi:hypothetical protein